MIASVLDMSLGKDNSDDNTAMLDSNTTNRSDPSHVATEQGMSEHEIKKIQMATALSFVSGLVMVGRDFFL